MKTSRLFFAFIIGSAVLYTMMILVGVQPGDSVLYSPPGFTHTSSLNATQKNIINNGNSIFDNSFTSSPTDTNIKNKSASTEINTPAKSIKNLDNHQTKYDFFDQKVSDIGRDDQGNYVVIIAANSEEKIIIKSSSPIYYPTEIDLNYGVKGCVLGGYYIELNHQIVLITTNGPIQTQQAYRCDYNRDTNNYTLNKS